MQQEQLYGCVERVVFRNEENGWSVLDVEDEEGQEHKVVGVMPTVFPGLMLQATGEFVEHPSFGKQFRVDSYEQFLPSAVPAILRYLASGAVKGVGAALAARIVQKFGADSLRIMEQDPMQLASIKGITAQKARQLGKDFAKQRALRDLIVFFSLYAIPADAAMYAYRLFGMQAMSKMRANPYQVCTGTGGISFEQADRIAFDLNFSVDDSRRIRAGILYVLRHNLHNGHTCLPASRLLPTAAQMLEADEQVVQTAFDALQESEAVICRQTAEEMMVHLPELYRAEEFVAQEIIGRVCLPQTETKFPQMLLRRIERETEIQYHEKQKEAILQAATRRFFILTGGPGTGKTTTLRGILYLLEQMGEKVAVAAPTGRAAQRISELTGYPAKTLHRLLEAQFGKDDELRFARNGENPLDVDTLIIDEASMVEAALMSHVMVALRPYTRVILVGDADQLPSIGAGNVLSDCLACRAVPSVRLTEVFRQALQSDIVSNAHRIVQGHLPQYSGKEGDCFFIATRSEQETLQTVSDLCARRLPAGYGITAFDGIQVLCPGRRGAIGSKELGRLLQNELNPEAQDKQEIKTDTDVLRVGDKVIQTRNNYDIPWTKTDGESGSGVFNGDIGRLVKIDKRHEIVTVQFDERVAEYALGDLRDLEPAYAITVHKSQGSEFEAVVLPIFHTPTRLCYRNLLYTAVTRAKRLLVVVGSADTVERMVYNNKRMRRYTALADLLLQELDV